MISNGTPRSFCFYGKGGVGKTSMATNLAAALAQQGQKVMIVGCSPKSNVGDIYRKPVSTTILDLGRAGKLNVNTIGQATMTTSQGVIIVETGGPEPGIGCAGRGLPTALNALQRFSHGVAGMQDVTYTFYDVIGDVVCGGFSTPMRQGPGIREVMIVTSGELMSLYAANNIVKSVVGLTEGGDTNVRVAGYIGNMRGVNKEREILEAFSELTNVPFLAYIPRAPEVFKEAEKRGGTIVEVLPEHEIAGLFQALAEKVKVPGSGFTPKPIEDYNELFEFFMSFQRSTAQGKEVAAYDFTSRIPEEISRREVPKRISIYGTGGIGKSTVSSNISAALVLLGEKVFQIGCDPKRDSIATICGGLRQTVLDEMHRKGAGALDPDELRSLVFEAPGYNGRLYGTECGGPSPGRGCAGKGVNLALELIEKYSIIDEYGFSFVLYDVLGDTVCGGFATPLKFARQTYIVTSGEFATMVQAMKIAQSVQATAQRSGEDVGIAGIINNMRGVPREKEIVEAVFGEVGLPVIHHIPRSSLVQEAENLKRTVIQAFPGSDQAKEYLELARKILANDRKIVPEGQLLSAVQIKEIMMKF